MHRRNPQNKPIIREPGFAGNWINNSPQKVIDYENPRISKREQIENKAIQGHPMVSNFLSHQ
jgi:hypothetical protein